MNARWWPNPFEMTPRRLLPGLRARDPLPAGWHGWHGLGAIFRPHASGERILTLNMGLQRQLAEARHQLQLAAAEIEQLKRAAEGVRARQAEFLAFVAHELRNPLAPIRTAVEVLSRGHAQDIPAMRSIVDRQVAQMSRMIDDLLDVSRASTGKLRLIPGHVCLSEVVAHAVDNVAPALSRRTQHLDIVRSGDDDTLDGDQTRLIQVLSNLLDNASKYSPDGQAIELTVTLLAQSVELCVVDHGIGMSSTALKNIFDPFAQEQHAVGFNSSGLGIGLSVVRDVVEAHGGRVSAFSAGLGRGSRFVVSLPRAAPRIVLSAA